MDYLEGLQEKAPLQKDHGYLRFPKLHLNKSQNFWNNILWTDTTKVEMF